MEPLVADRMQVIGRYVLGAQVGVGGMASVYVGRLMGAADFSRVVAIKRLHPQFLFDHDRAARFRDEARLSSGLIHPNIVQVIDVVESEHELLIVMEYVHGVSLRALLEDSKTAGCRLPTNIAAGIIVPVLYGLHAAHEATDHEGQPLGLVHRDVSPSNIMVSADGHAKILDFGVAKARTDAHVTSAGLISGKYGYFAPEQVSGAVLDRRADVFAAGTVLWEMLTGERLFCDPVAEVAPSFDRLLHRTVPPPSSLNRDIPDRLDQIVLRALARSPDQRHVSARALALELEATIEVASPSTVSGFVECVCSKRLASLSRTLSSAKGRTPAPQGMDGTAVTRPAQGETSLSSLSGECALAETVAERPSARKPRLMPKVLAVGTALVALALFLSLRRGSSSETVAARTAETVGSRVVNAPPPEPVAKMPAGSPQAPDALPAAEDVVRRLDQLVEQTPTANAMKDPNPSAPSPRKRPGTKKTAKRDCDPPTYLDADGIRVFKEECL